MRCAISTIALSWRTPRSSGQVPGFSPPSWGQPIASHGASPALRPSWSPHSTCSHRPRSRRRRQRPRDQLHRGRRSRNTAGPPTTIVDPAREGHNGIARTPTVARRDAPVGPRGRSWAEFCHLRHLLSRVLTLESTSGATVKVEFNSNAPPNLAEPSRRAALIPLLLCFRRCRRPRSDRGGHPPKIDFRHLCH